VGFGAFATCEARRDPFPGLRRRTCGPHFSMRVHSSGSENCGNISSRRIGSWRAVQTCCHCSSDALKQPAVSSDAIARGRIAVSGHTRQANYLAARLDFAFGPTAVTVSILVNRP